MDGIEEGDGDMLRRRGDQRGSVSTLDVEGGGGEIGRGDVERRRTDRRNSPSETGDRDRDLRWPVTGLSWLPV